MADFASALLRQPPSAAAGFLRDADAAAPMTADTLR